MKVPLAKIARRLSEDGYRLALLTGESDELVTDLQHSTGAPIEGFDAVIGWSDSTLTAHATGSVHDVNAVTLLAPFPNPPRNMLCVGRNYSEHTSELIASGYDTSSGEGSERDNSPLIVFTKPATSIIGPTSQIVVEEPWAHSIDYEAELAVVIGTAGQGIGLNDAWRHVYGYMIINDITSRELQRRHRQWFLGKALDGSCPTGPVLVTSESLDASDLRIRLSVNDEIRQEARTSQMLLDIPGLVSTISKCLRLVPGDIIATGTPSGVGIGFDPPKFLTDRDVIRTEIEGIGELENEIRVVATASHSQPTSNAALE